MALSAASSHAIYAPELSRIETGKPWTVSASLRGFYDDNWATAPKSFTGKKDSWGFEARPYVGLNFPMDQSFLGLSYLNSSRFYEARERMNANAWDFTHEFGLKFDHAFSPRYRIGVRDSLLYGQEPDTSGLVSLPGRADVSYLRNTALINFFGQLTPELGISLDYQNTLVDYLGGIYSPLLDRMEHHIPVALHWQVKPELVAVVGYTLGLVNYTGDAQIDPINNPAWRSDSRDSLSHSFFVGGDYDITGLWRASARVGATYTDYVNDPAGETQLTPYVDASTSYSYAVGSRAELGFKHTLIPTDNGGLVAGAARPTLDQEVSSIYLNVNHQITPKLYGNVLVQYQFGSFHGGAADSTDEQFLMLGLYLTYRINQFLSLETGYNYDKLMSDWTIGGVDQRSYDRNRVFFGVRGTY